MKRSLGYNVVFFIAALASALAMGAALAHALELPNKIGLSAEAYFTVQKAYNGWDRLGFLLLVELLSLVALAVLSRHEPRVLWPVLTAIACLLAAQALFWIYTFPANAATHNWTVIAADWQSLSRQWEYSHAGGAGLQILAVSSVIVALLAKR